MGNNKNKQVKKGKKKTFKADIVHDYITEFPNTSTVAIARMIAKQYPADFNVESARTMIRTYRDGHKGNEPIRTEEERKKAMGKFNIPKTDYVPQKPYIIPAEHNRLLLLSDVHIPYHDEDAVKVALEFGHEHGMNAIYLNGDFMDCYQISRFTKDPRNRSMSGELEDTREFLQYMQETYKLPIYYKIGNHEDRWMNYLRNNAPELIGEESFELSKVLRFDEYGVIEIESKVTSKAGKLSILHGHEFGHSVFSPVSPARGLYMRAKENALIGHHHQTSEHSEKSLNGDVVTCWSTGALCGTSPDYMPYNKWNLGFAFVTFDPETGHFLVENKRIINGEVR